MTVQQQGSTDNYQIVWTPGGEILITTEDEFVSSETLEFAVDFAGGETVEASASDGHELAESLFSTFVGTITWGHKTSVEEDSARSFLSHWSGTGLISGSGDSEILTLDEGEYEESEVVNVGANEIEIIVDNYQSGSGPAPVVKYKDGDSEANCEADSWNTYSAPFTSSGYIKVRVEAQ